MDMVIDRKLVLERKKRKKLSFIRQQYYYLELNTARTA